MSSEECKVCRCMKRMCTKGARVHWSYEVIVSLRRWHHHDGGTSAPRPRPTRKLYAHYWTHPYSSLAFIVRGEFTLASLQLEALALARCRWPWNGCSLIGGFFTFFQSYLPSSKFFCQVKPWQICNIVKPWIVTNTFKFIDNQWWYK